MRSCFDRCLWGSNDAEILGLSMLVAYWQFLMKREVFSGCTSGAVWNIDRQDLVLGGFSKWSLAELSDY